MVATDRSAVRISRSTTLSLWSAAATLSIGIPLAFTLNIWQDEAFTLHTTAGSLGYAFVETLRFEQSAPLYFILVALWRMIAGSDPGVIRMVSVACCAYTAAMLPELARRYLPSVNYRYVCVAVVCNPFFIWASVEMRPYALIILISALLLLFFYDGFLRNEPSTFSTVAYTLTIVVAFYTQYYLAFLVFAQFSYLFFTRRSAVLRFLGSAAIAAVSFAPLIVVVPAQVANFRSAFTPPSLIKALSIMAGILARYVLPFSFERATLLYLALAVLVVLAIAIFARRGVFVRSNDSAIIAITVVAAGTFVIVTYLGGVHILNRHAASLFVPSVLSVFAALTHIRVRERMRGIALWTAATLVASLVSLFLTYQPLAKPGDWIRLNAYLQRHESAHEPIVVFEAENALPFAYYYRGRNPIVALPNAVSWERYDVTQFVLRDEAHLRAAMPTSRRIWLITAGECVSSNIVFGCDLLERYVKARYVTLESANFYGSRIRLLALMTPNQARSQSDEISAWYQ